MDEQNTLIPIVIIEDAQIDVIQPYGNELAAIGEQAQEHQEHEAFKNYQKDLAENTIRRHKDDLACFHRFLVEHTRGSITRTAMDLYNDPWAWHDMNAGTLKTFKEWCESKGFAAKTINNRLGTVRLYCMLAGPKHGNVLDHYTVSDIMEVKGYTDKKAIRLDQRREKEGIPTRIGRKKASSTPLTPEQALELKKTTLKVDRPKHRNHDKLLEARDWLIACLCLEHSLRSNELLLLKIENYNPRTGILTFDRPKTLLFNQRHKLEKHSKIAMERYIALIKELEGRTRGPLFTGYTGKPISRQALYKRINLIGEQMEIPNLSLHDIRHEWTYNKMEQVREGGIPIHKVMKAGGWKKLDTLLGYLDRTGIANEGLEITEEE